MKLLVAVVLYFLFFMMCYLGTGTDKKNIKSFHSYPNEVQKRVQEDGVLGNLVPKKNSMLLTIISNVLMFTIVFSLIGITLKDVLNISKFQTAFIYFLILGEGLNLFDLVVIDLLWWRHSKRIRFSCVLEKEMYQNPKKHIESFLRGIPTFALAALFAALIVG